MIYILLILGVFLFFTYLRALQINVRLIDMYKDVFTIFLLGYCLVVITLILIV